MTTMISYGVDNYGEGRPVLAVVLDETSFQYVFPEGMEPPFTPEERLAALGIEDTAELSVDALKAAATYNIGLLVFTEWKPGTFEEAQGRLDEAAENDDSASRTSIFNADAGTNAITLSGEEGDFPSQEEMLVYVVAALGDIDPEGPNGFLLRALDGKPRPGDEDMVIDYSNPRFPLGGRPAEFSEEG